jgi:hypothetical protein
LTAQTKFSLLAIFSLFFGILSAAWPFFWAIVDQRLIDNGGTFGNLALPGLFLLFGFAFGPTPCAKIAAVCLGE